MTKSHLAAAAVLFLATTGLAGAKDWTTVRIGSEGAYPPFNSIDSNNELQGFDIDIAKALCEKMQVECTFVTQDWDGMIPALTSGKYDAIIASMSITDERKQVIDFTDKYYTNSLTFVASDESGFTAVGPADLAGKTLGAQSSTVSATFLEENYGESDIKLYPTQDEVNLDLVAGRIDMLFVDKLPGLEWLKTADGGNYEFVGTDLPTDGVGAGVRQADTDLRDQISEAIVAIKADGTYDKINAKYFPFSIWKD